MVSGFKAPKYVYPDRSRHGQVRYYMCRGRNAKKYRVLSEIGSPAFWEAYARFQRGEEPYPRETALRASSAQRGAAGKGATSSALKARKVAKPNTLAWLMSEYRESTNWKKLGLSTRRARALIIDKIVAEPHPRMLGLAWGDCPLADIAPRHIREIRDANLIWDPVVDPETGEDTGDVAMTNKEGSNGWLKTLRAAYAWAFNDRKMNLPSDPTLGIKLYPGSKQGFHCWSVGEIEAYRAKHPIGSKARLALEVLLFTGQRRGDAVRLGAGLMSTDTHGRPMFIFEQQKNGGTERATVAHVPLFPWLREIVQATPCAGSEFILCQDDGSPYTKESFGNMFRGWCNEAGLHECSAHGLRKAFVVEMIRRKRRPQEIMGVTGHTTMKEFDRYARAYMRQNAVEQMLDDFEAEHANAA